MRPFSRDEAYNEDALSPELSKSGDGIHNRRNGNNINNSALQAGLESRGRDAGNAFGLSTGVDMFLGSICRTVTPATGFSHWRRAKDS